MSGSTFRLENSKCNMSLRKGEITSKAERDMLSDKSGVQSFRTNYEITNH